MTEDLGFSGGWEVWKTGVPGLDHVLGGGIPKLSLTLISGGPGSGKTILAQQILHYNATPQSPALYFTIMGEPVLKLLRYQRRMSYFDERKLVNGSIRFVSLEDEFESRDLGRLLDAIERRVRDINPSLMAIDSFRSLSRTMSFAGQETQLQTFVDNLGLFLATWQTTSFLVGEYRELEESQSPVFSLADNILWLHQSVERNSVVRKMQVAKVRGQASQSGLHTFRITSNGIDVFPRIPAGLLSYARQANRLRMSTGVADLNEMMGGGIPTGDAVMVAGPSGTGKSILGLQFVAEGLSRGEAAVVAVFEEHPGEYVARAKDLGFDLQQGIDKNLLRILYIRPLDLSVDETLLELQTASQSLKASRLVIDSVSGFELALAPTFREDFRESFYRLISQLTSLGVTVLMTGEIVENFTELRFSSHFISFLADDVILLRYVEINGELKRMLTVAKMRNSGHSKDLRLYDITDKGIEIGKTLDDYQGIVTDMPTHKPLGLFSQCEGLVVREVLTLRTIAQLGQATVSQLSKATGLQRKPLSRAIERLLELDYIDERDEIGQRIFHLASTNNESSS
jgi:circadian clock protein KaiC